MVRRLSKANSSRTNDGDTDVVILGASTRAAAFSAMRAGLKPWCVDLFADADLRRHCPAAQLASKNYPHGLQDAVETSPAAPWMYTGGLENWPALIDEIAKKRILWGNSGEIVTRVRSPLLLKEVLDAAGIPAPRVQLHPDSIPAGSSWLMKPQKSAGGAKIRFWTRNHHRSVEKKDFYFQEYINGAPCSAVYVGIAGQAQLLGVTYQLVGESWLHAAPFHYCGSMGPIRLSRNLQQDFERLGGTLTSCFDLKGLFGVDCILRDDVPWPIEVNPRYTASVEVIEYATGMVSVAKHRKAFDLSSTSLFDRPRQTGCAGKAILFARGDCEIPADGPWTSALDSSFCDIDIRSYADIPRAGEHIQAGRPIMTVLGLGASPEECLADLQKKVTDLDRRLFS